MAERAGFTLVEMLVAMAVFSLAALALLNLAGENARAQGRVETRVLAGIVADNLAVEALASPAPPALGESVGEAPLAGRDWPWTRTVTATEDPEILRIDIRVQDGWTEAAALTVFASLT